jgi:hypothetical protein
MAKTLHLYAKELAPETADGHFVLVFVTIEDPQAIGRSIEDTKTQLLNDARRTHLAPVRELRERSFNYTADHPSVRDTVFMVLGTLDFKAYVWHSARRNGLGWSGHILEAIVSRCVRRGYGAVRLHAAEGNQIERDKHDSILPALLNGVRGAIMVHQRFRVVTLEGDDACQVIPDYLCGVLHAIFEGDELGGKAMSDVLQHVASQIETVVDVHGTVMCTGEMFVEDLRRRSVVP